MPQPQVHSPGKGREALRQKVLNLSFKIRYGLTVHIIRLLKKILQAKFSIFQKLSHQVKFQRITQIPRNSPHSPRITQNSHILLTYPTCVSGTCPGREPYRIPANYANPVQFAHTVRE